MSKRIDILNKRFGKLLVLSFAGCANTHATWNVQCDCGKCFTVTYSNLKNGTSACSSCGNTTHGLTDTSYYGRWLTMKEKHKNNICIEWLSFDNFKNDTYATFKDKYSLRRIDPLKPYSKENCYWSVPQQKRCKKNERILFV